MADEAGILMRYTELPYLLNMLESNTLIIPNCQEWADKNDRFAISEYQRAKPDSFVYALCMTKSIETFHHWKIYTSGVGGVCLKFSRPKLEEWAKNQENGIVIREVVYHKFHEFGPDDICVEDLPFSKRVAFRDENECRLVCTRTDKEPFIELPFPVNALEAIQVNPFVNGEVAESVKNSIRHALGSNDKTISHSEMIDSQRWQNIISEVVDSSLT